VTLEVLTAVSVQITVFWNVTPYSLVHEYATSHHVSKDSNLLSGVNELISSDDPVFQLSYLFDDDDNNNNNSGFIYLHAKFISLTVRNIIIFCPENRGGKSLKALIPSIHGVTSQTTVTLIHTAERNFQFHVMAINFGCCFFSLLSFFENKNKFMLSVCLCIPPC
jgi:hypothetical protein